ncbi:hypothetical protein ASD19_12825 [Microbacterium sp. Root53]|uniref:DUF6766 family protein n=1 Tax=Microbacterium sp. Root53 TaxID=1736553 RepID=UPI0006F5B031|nr:DUF6766 family protein [Microbacterium sp. Root53]KQZ06605.1 hypothetical protein ASD19_12825 [Microbacterium sp. Root53]
MRAVKDNALSLFFLALFALTVLGQALVGHANENEELIRHDQAPVSLGEFVTSSEFLVDVSENWQSEFLQFFLFILATVWLVQRGSPESKKPGDEGLGTDEDQMVGRHARPDSPPWARADGWRRWLLANSMLLVMGTIFLLSWWAQSLGGLVVANQEAMDHGELPMTWLSYVASPEFWNRTLQNWQSEFLAVGCMVAFSIYLRQRGSAESKPVGTPNGTAALESE